MESIKHKAWYIINTLIMETILIILIKGLNQMIFAGYSRSIIL